MKVRQILALCAIAGSLTLPFQSGIVLAGDRHGDRGRRGCHRECNNVWFIHWNCHWVCDGDHHNKHFR